jgi:hypothetical protein
VVNTATDNIVEKSPPIDNFMNQTIDILMINDTKGYFLFKEEEELRGNWKIRVHRFDFDLENKVIKLKKEVKYLLNIILRNKTSNEKYSRVYLKKDKKHLNN